jgi:hypothetical protein
VIGFQNVLCQVLQVISLRQNNDFDELIIGFDRFVIMSLFYFNILYDTHL